MWEQRESGRFVKRGRVVKVFKDGGKLLSVIATELCVASVTVMRLRNEMSNWVVIASGRDGAPPRLIEFCSACF